MAQEPSDVWGEEALSTSKRKSRFGFTKSKSSRSPPRGQLTTVLLAGASTDRDGDSILKYNGQYQLTARKVHGYPLFVHAGVNGTAGETLYLYRHKKSGRWVVTDAESDINKGEGSIVSQIGRASCRERV